MLFKSLEFLEEGRNVYDATTADEIGARWVNKAGR